jgi:hypothetical protein
MFSGGAVVFPLGAGHVAHSGTDILKLLDSPLLPTIPTVLFLGCAVFMQSRVLTAVSRLFLAVRRAYRPRATRLIHPQYARQSRILSSFMAE